MEAAEVIARAAESRYIALTPDVRPSWIWGQEIADAILAALREAGYTIVPTASIVNGIAQLAHVRGQVEGGYTDEVIETVSAETARMLWWIEAEEHGEDR